MALEAKGCIAIVEAVIYALLLAIALFTMMKSGFHGFGRGWITFSIFMSIRIASDIITIIEETKSEVSTGLIIAALVLSSIGLSPLVSVGFQVANKLTMSIHGTELPAHIKKLTRIVHILLIVSMGLSIGAASDLTSDKSSEISNGVTLLKASTCLITAAIALLGLLALIHMDAVNMIGTSKNSLIARRSELALIGVLPFYIMRTIYSTASAFTLGSDGIITSHPSPWNFFEGSWRIYLVLAVIPQIIISTIYIFMLAVTDFHIDITPKDYEMERGPESQLC
ncbi:hypothetical protein V1511DRAFT_379594 [Dipodascopsis uninucleata]